jgi:hypothetical protein
MSRRKRGFKFDITSGVTITVVGILLLFISILLLLSFFQLFGSGEGTGRFLMLINQYLTSNFGGVSIGIPFLTILLAGHCFNTKKLTLIHWRPHKDHLLLENHYHS